MQCAGAIPVACLGLWFLPNPAFGLNTNDDDICIFKTTKFSNHWSATFKTLVQCANKPFSQYFCGTFTKICYVRRDVATCDGPVSRSGRSSSGVGNICAQWLGDL